MIDLRPAWQTVRRINVLGPTVAVAARDGVCPGCGGEVVADEPIVCRGFYTVVEPDGARRLDLSGAEWVCQPCAVQAVPA